MVRNLTFVTALAAALLIGDRQPASRADGPAPPLTGDLSKLAPGMTQADVRHRLGSPKQIARQILYRRYLEQWVYEGANPVRIEFDCVRGKEPQILTVHPLTPAGP